MYGCAFGTAAAGGREFRNEKRRTDLALSEV